MSPKERVRGNIYKELFNNEKSKNKKMAFASLSLFVVGLFSGSAYQSMKEINAPTNTITAFIPRGTENARSIKTKLTSELLDQLPQITLEGNREFTRSITEITEQNITIDHILNDNVFEVPRSEIDTDKLFGLDDVQI